MVGCLDLVDLCVIYDGVVNSSSTKKKCRVVKKHEVHLQGSMSMLPCLLNWHTVGPLIIIFVPVDYKCSNEHTHSSDEHTSRSQFLSPVMS